MKLGRKIGIQDEGGAVTPGTGSDKPGAAPDAPAGKSGAPEVAKPASSKPKSQRRSTKRGYLDGQMLIAMPTMGDERFARTVIYVCAHSSEGAMGIIVNQPAPQISFRD